MLFNYLKVALRSLTNSKTYTFINILGLSVGIASSVLIMLYVSHEISFDRFHTKAPQIHRMLGRMNWGGQEILLTGMSSKFGPTMKAQIPEVENQVRMQVVSKAIVERDASHRYFENKFVFADTSFFSVFSFPVLEGQVSALAAPGKVMLTKESAIRYFGTTQVIGKTITYNKKYEFEIVGLVEQAPSNSTLQFDFIASFSTLGQIEEEKAQYNNEKIQLGSYTTYLLLQPSVNKELVEKKISSLVKSREDTKFILEAFTSIHLGNSILDTSNTRHIVVFAFVALLILSLTIINYMNLTTARAASRAREAGIRKVIGARKLSISLQFYVESALLTLTSFALALVLVELFMPLMLTALDQRLDRSFLTSPLFLQIMAGMLIVCIVISGSYPAWVMSRFQPVEVLKGKMSGRGQNAWMRKGFTTFQFAVSIGLIICTLVIGDQLAFIRSKNIGLNKEQVMVVELSPESSAAYAAIKNDIRQLSGIKNVAAASLSLYKGGTNMFFTKTPTTHEDVGVASISIDENFPETLGLSWVKPNTEKIKPGQLIINESALELLKIEHDPIGMKLQLGDNSQQISGMVHDFNYSSLHSRIEGLVMDVLKDNDNTINQYGGSLYVRIDPAASMQEKVAEIKKVYEQYKTGTPFEFYFLDEAFNSQYLAEERLAKLFGIFAGIGIGLACLGLFGLVTFALERRVKEIGIRKVLGASLSELMYLLSVEFAWLFAVSILLAAPLAVWYMNKWLSTFPYRTDISLSFILIAAGITLLVACFTISIKTFRLSQVNPVDSLRNE